MNVTCFFQHYHTPDCATGARPHSLVRHLARSHDVTLVTTDAWRTKRLAHRFDWVPDGVRLVEVPVPYRNAMGTAQRLGAFAQYAVRAVCAGVRLPRPDVIFGSSTPLSVGVVAALLARWHRVPWVLEITDLWPDFPIQMGAIPTVPLQKALYGLEHFLYRDAAHVITHSPDMTTHVETAAPEANASTALYGTDVDVLDAVPSSLVAKKRALLSPTGRRIVLYAGSFGRANDIPTLLNVARRLQDRNVTFVFAGRGYYEERLRAAAASLDAVHVLPPVPLPESLALFRAADLSLVSFIDRPVLATNAPGKLFDSLAAGTPVVVTNPGWTARLVREHRCGWVVPPENPDALASAIESALDSPDALDAAGRRGREWAHTHANRKDALDHVDAVLRRVARS